MKPQKESFITVRRTNCGRFLMRSPFIPELFVEGEGAEQSIKRLTILLPVVLQEYTHRERDIMARRDLDSRASARELVKVHSFVEVRSESGERFLMTSPVLPQLFAEGRGAYESIIRLTSALKAVLEVYVLNRTEIPMP